MTTMEREPTQLLGYLEGRIEEQSVAIQEVKDGQQQILARFDQRVDQLAAELRADLQRVNDRIDRLHLALFGIGGAIFAGQIGVVITLILK